MKSIALSCWALGLGLLAACGGGTEAPRGADSGGSGGAGSAVTSGVGPTGVAGTLVSGGSGAGGGGASPQSPGGGGRGGAPAKSCGPMWMKGMTYSPGAIVLFAGNWYVAEHENPGYDPAISTYFWEPYDCEGGAAGGSAGVGGGDDKPPVGESSFDDVVSEQLFNELFPGRNAFYTYQGLVAATKSYPAFAGSGTSDDRKREAAAFLANVARETGELVYIEQIAKDAYCQPSAACPCEPGKLYFGRGPIQISWNYNYCAAGKELGLDLRANPDLVAQDATIAWETGLWFWMTQSGAGTQSPHAGITGGMGFGETVRSINGGQECNGKWPEAVNARVAFYQRFCEILGVDPGSGQQC